MQTRFSIVVWTLLIGLLFVPLACVDQDFDQPPPGGIDPNLAVNISIAEVKATHTLGAYEQITEDWTFSGIVVSDDAEGNFFKQLVIQDSTGGIEMRIEMTNLSNVYPPGRKVYVKAKGLWIGDYRGLIQLGAGVGTDDRGDPELIRIPESILSQYLVTATYDNPVVPKTITIDQLSESDVSTLVRFDNVQFIGADAGQTYADAVLEESLNREIEDCSKKRILLRTSGFASFAGDTTPTKNGTLIGVLGIFGDDFQLTIRDLGDVDMAGDRCGSGNATSIESVRNQYTGSQTTLSGGTIKGVVISDFSSASVTGRNLYIQDATGGIVLRFDANHSFALGSEILVDVSGGLLGEFNGLLQVDGLTLGAASLESIAGDVAPRTATVAEVLANAQAWESTLVEIKDVNLSGTDTYNGSVTVTDASGAMILFTRSQATFSGDPIPSGTVTLKAIVSEFNSPQLIIRNTSDVSGGGSSGGEIDEDFTGLSHNADITLSGWANIAVKGSRLWRSQIFSGNTYAQATAFNDAANEMESWLITPPIELDVAKKLTFESAYGFYTHDGLSVWISGNFNGTDVTSATWQQLSPVLSTSSDTEHAFIPSGNVDLSGFSGTVRVGFKYVGSGPGGQTTSWRIDNVKVTAL